MLGATPKLQGEQEAGEYAMNVDERKLEVLRAIVEDFIATSEPVGSRALVDRHNLGV
jgi:hypothetical protein